MKKKWNTLIVGCLMLIVILTGCGAAMDDTESEVLEKEDTETAVPIDPSKIIFPSDKDMDITVSEVDIEPGKEEEWIVTNVHGRRNLFSCDYKDSDIYYFFTYARIPKECSEILLFDGDKHYYITGDDIDTYKKTLVKLGQINQVTFVLAFHTIKDENTMYFQNVIRRGENIRGTFTQQGGKDVVGYEGTLKESEGIIEQNPYGDKAKQSGYDLNLSLFLNGVKTQEISEFMSSECGRANYPDLILIKDFNGDGFLDIGIEIFKVSRVAIATNYYIYDPADKEFVRVPVADDLGLAFPIEETSYDGRFYMMSVTYGKTKMEGIYSLWQWNQYKIEKFAEVEFCFLDETEDRWTACVTGCDANGNVIGKRYISSNTDDWDAVWMEAERHMRVYAQ